MHYRSALALALVLVIFLTSLGLTVSAQGQTAPALSSSDNDYFVLYQDPNGDTICREAAPAERDDIEKNRPKNPRQINHLGMDALAGEPQSDNDGTHLTIILRATQSLEENAPAKAAFLRAAAAWEALIHSSATIYLDADLTSVGFTNPNTLGSTVSPSQTFTYTAVRSALLNAANTAEKQTIYNALPSIAVPIDISPGTAGSVLVSASIGRTLGLLNPTAQETDPKASIKFNSAFSFDFDSTDGITAGTTDFEAVATHEIGHALGFTSRSGSGATTPAIWDLYRFRSGTTSATFTTAARIMSIGGPPENPLQFFFAPGITFDPGVPEIGLSTGGPDAVSTNGGDGHQSSHWKRRSLNGGVLIGIMDPIIPSGTHREIGPNDTKALDIFGYNSTAAAPPPAPANDNFSAAQAISDCVGTTTGSNVNATRETGEPIHLQSPQGSSGSRSIWYSWQAPVSGSATISTAGSAFDTVLAVYTGNAVNSLTLIGNNDDVDPGVNLTSSVTFTATAGTTYRIAVDGFNNSGSGGDVGAVTLNWALDGCGVSFSPTVLNANQVELKNWTIDGRTSIYVKLSFPDAGYRVSNWGTPVQAGSNFTVDALVEKFNGPSAQVLTNTAQIYDLGNIAAGNYTFTFKNSGTTVDTLNFTVSFTAPPANPIDDPREFVRWQYKDFLGREPDGPGWDHWTGEITMCSNPANRFAGETEPQCIERKRANTSAAFFLSPEHANTSYFVLRVYCGSLGRMPKFGGDTTPQSEYTRDRATVSNGIVVNNALDPNVINANKQAFVNEFVTRAEFQSIYGSLNNTQYVDKLFQTTGVTPTSNERQALIDGLNGGSETRASVLFKVVDGTQTITDGALIFNTSYGQAFYNNLFNAAFVQVEYFGYLQRDPDDGGYNFWLGKLNQFGNWVDAQMVLAFIKSPEYRSRFGAP